MRGKRIFGWRSKLKLYQAGLNNEDVKLIFQLKAKKRKLGICEKIFLDFNKNFKQAYQQYKSRQI